MKNCLLQNQSFVWGNGLISANGEDSFYYLQDHLGSPIRLIGEEQNTPLAYDEFGVPLVGASINQPFGFTGYQTDDMSGLYYAQARYYAPELGRFGGEDTHWGPGNMQFGDIFYTLPNSTCLPDIWAIRQSTNLYNYALHNPILLVDVNGRWIHIAIGGLAGGLIGGGISFFSQASQAGWDFSQVDGMKVLIAAGTGAASGALASTGAGLLVQIGGNAILGAASNATEQTYEIISDKYDRSEYDLLDISISGIVGGAAGIVGGPGGGSNAIQALSNQTIKRITNAVTYHLGRDASKEILKALAYYAKSSSTLIMREIIKSIVKASGVAVAHELIKASGLQDAFKNEMLDYATCSS